MQHMINLFIPLATLLLMFVAIIWSSKDLPNILIKMVYILSTLFGLVLTYELLIRPMMH